MERDIDRENLDSFTNPFDEQLTRLKWTCFWLFIGVLVFFSAYNTLFNVPAADPAGALGDLYFIYVVVMSLAVISTFGLCFFLGVASHVYVMKKATDEQFKMLGAITRAREEPGYIASLEASLSGVQKK